MLLATRPSLASTHVSVLVQLPPRFASLLSLKLHLHPSSSRSLATTTRTAAQRVSLPVCRPCCASVLSYRRPPFPSPRCASLGVLHVSTATATSPVIKRVLTLHLTNHLARSPCRRLASSTGSFSAACASHPPHPSLSPPFSSAPPRSICTRQALSSSSSLTLLPPSPRRCCRSVPLRDPPDARTPFEIRKKRCAPRTKQCRASGA